jgi:hypothetical protein
MKELISELENYLVNNKSKLNDEKLNELKNNIVCEFQKKYKLFYVGKIIFNDNSVNFIEYNKDMNINDYDFIIPVRDLKLILLIENFNGKDNDMDSGINNYIKKIQQIYKKIYELDGIILKFI